MRLKISHMTEYSYAEAVEFALQRLRLTPLDCPGQRVVSWQTSVTGAGREAVYTDHFGNRVELVSINDGGQSISIMAMGEIETEERNGVFGPHIGYVPLWLYLRETPLTKAGKLLKEFGTVNAIDCRNENELLIGELSNWRVQKVMLGK